jgi:hypothetical protein
MIKPRLVFKRSPLLVGGFGWVCKSRRDSKHGYAAATPLNAYRYWLLSYAPASHENLVAKRNMLKRLGLPS